MLRAEEISHIYGHETILHKITLAIPKNSFTVLTGESGSGKSTLLSILSSLLHPTQGEVFYEDIALEKILDINRFRNETIGFVFQFHYLIPHLTVFENIKLAGRQRTEAIPDLLARLGILKLANKYPDEISGGERQRAAIARALINKPDWLFADEPTGNLDSKNSRIVFDLLRELDTTVIVATHDRSKIRNSDQVIQMQDGRLC